MFNHFILNQSKIFIILFFCYVFLAIGKVVTGTETILYLLVPIFFLLVIVPTTIRKRTFVLPICILLCSFLVGIILYITRTSNTGALTPLFILCYVSTFYYYQKYYSFQFSDKEFLKVSNYCYLIYLLFSIFTYNFFSASYIYIPSFLFIDRIFHGIEGSPAYIDSYSAIILVINFFYNKSWTRFILYFSTILTMITTGAITPVLIILVVFLSYIFLRLFKSYGVLFILFFTTMGSIFILSLSNELINFFLLIATNGRNIIWDQQIGNMGMYNFFFGDVASAEVKINWSSGQTNNPHNLFLFIILRFGGLLFLLFTCILYFKTRTKELHKKLLVMAYLAAGISNSNFFYIGNPFYFYLLCFCFTKNNVTKISNNALSLDNPLDLKIEKN